MTDFLSRLVERSFGAPVIRPRVAFLFEPMLGAGELASPESREHSVTDWPERNPIPRVPGRRDESVEDARLEPGLELEETTIRAPAASPPRRAVPQTPAWPQSAVRATPPTVSGPGQNREHMRAPENTEPDAAVDPRPLVIQSKILPSVVDPRAEPDGIVAPSSAARPEQTGLLVPSRIVTRVAAELRNSVPTANPRSRDRNAEPPLPTVNHQAQAERNVHVTIGRIEVRAPARDKAPSRERAVSPVMGLDEYLRRQVRRCGQ
jgi:hypothetical protein